MYKLIKAMKCEMSREKCAFKCERLAFRIMRMKRYDLYDTDKRRKAKGNTGCQEAPFMQRFRPVF